jgi:hypothetical protein
MTDDDIEIRRLAREDAVLYRDIRLEALQANPEAFGSSRRSTSRRQCGQWSEDRQDKRPSLAYC